MKLFKKIYEVIISKISIFYIEFVYKTSKIKKVGNLELLKSNYDEKFILCIWHGENYCYYPFLKGKKIHVITTMDRRGDYISNISRHFGYFPMRVPDESVGGNHLFKIRSSINGKDKGNLALTMDGPLGPYHVPKDFIFTTARFTNRRLLPLTIEIKRKINFEKRWDKYTIPLPFNSIKIQVHEPIEVDKKKLKENVDELKKELRSVMEI
ncbi:MAG: lysophospholipid acyltransferase family protein [Eubacteriaceae bacterium]